ncbi:hypothetical protein RDABS01_034003 [Bienertia sinuspersici]
MAEIKLISEFFVKPKHEVEAAKHPCHLSPIEIGMLSIHPIQKGLLFTLNDPLNSSDRIKVVSNLIDKLKQSLSIALIHFYPLAGRFETQLYPEEHACSIFIDCVKGPGARLIHATAPRVTLSDIVSSTNVPTFVQALFELGEKSVNYDGHTRALVSIQVTELTDGVFIGFTMNHSVVDGTSFIHFVSMLSEIYRSLENNTRENNPIKISRVPVFNYKPWVTDNEDLSVIKLPYLESEEFITRKFNHGPLREQIFHFSAQAMATLKDRANKEYESTDNVLSSFQALSAFVWRSITRARNLPLDESTSCTMLINARSRFDPPISNDYFGNFIGGAKADCNVGELMGHNLGWATMNLNKEIKSQDGETIIGLYKMVAKSPMVLRPGVGPGYHGLNKVIIGGSARFNMYGPEFGLGRAIAARMGFGNKEDGKVTANPGCEEGGSVDLEICLNPLTMAALETDSEFMSVVSLH